MVVQTSYAEETLPFFHSCSPLVYSGIISSLQATASHCELTFEWISVFAPRWLQHRRFCLPPCQHDLRSSELDARPCRDSIQRQAQVSPSQQVTPARSLLTSSILESSANVIRGYSAFSTRFLIKRLNSDGSRKLSLKLHWKHLPGITIPQVQALLMLCQITSFWSCWVFSILSFLSQNYIQLNAC